jgi:hypothetical protein
MLLCLVLLTVCLVAAGCGNVSLKGEAMTACEQSALDAYQAVKRVDTPTTQPAGQSWVRPYLTENFKQWRYFVRAAKNDPAWGPKLEGE